MNFFGRLGSCASQLGTAVLIPENVRRENVPRGTFGPRFIPGACVPLRVLPGGGSVPVLRRRIVGTPARLIVLGAALAFAPLVLDAAVSLDSSLAFLSGNLTGIPYWLFLLDVALTGLLAPAGLFLALCGVLLSVRQLRPQGLPLAYRAGLSGAGVNLAAGLMLGLLNLSQYLLPLDFLTADLIRSEVLVAFAATVAAGSGIFLVFCAIAVLLRSEPVTLVRRRGTIIRMRRGKRTPTPETTAAGP